MRHFLVTLICVSTAIVASTVSGETISFRRHLAPILVRRCLGCHDNKKTEGRYALHTFEMLLKAGDSGDAPVVPGNADESYLYAKIMETDEDLRMPQEDEPLSPKQLSQFRQWINQGAVFDGSENFERLTAMLPTRKHPQPPQTYRTAIPVFALEFSRDGKLLLSGGWHELLVWNVKTGKLQNRVSGLPQRVHCLELSPDGQTLAVGGGAPGEYGEIRLVDASLLSQSLPNNGEVRAARVDHELLGTWDDVVLDLRYSSDGKSLVAGGADHSVRGYDVASRKESWRNTQHADWVTAVDITDYRFSERLVSNVPNDGVPKLFTFNKYEQQGGSHVEQQWQFADGSYVVRKANWELESRAESGQKPAVRSLTKITISGIGKTYKVKREAFHGEALESRRDVIDRLTELQASWPTEIDSSELVVSSSKDRTVKVFRRSDGKLFTTYKGHRREYGPLKGMHRVFGASAEPNSRRIWSGGEGNHFHGWNPITVRDEDGTAADMEARFAKEYSIDLIRHDFSDAVFSLRRYDGRLFAASADGQVQAFAIKGPEAKFDVNQVATSQVFAGQSDHLYALAVSLASSDEQRVAAAGFAGEIVIWDRTSGSVVNRFIAAPMNLSERPKRNGSSSHAKTD